MTDRIPAVRLVLAALLLAPAGAVTIPASAQAEGEGQVSWSVQPSTPSGPDGRTEFDYRVAPGTTISDWVSVSNFSARPATFRVYGADAITDSDTAAFTLTGAERASTDLGAWTSIDSSSAVCSHTNDAAEAACTARLGVQIVLEPGNRIDIPFTVTVPHDATPGDHAAGIVASFQETATDSTGSAVQVNQRVGTRIYLRVDGTLTPKLGVSGTASGYDGSWNPFGPGTGRVGFALANTGNVRLSARPVVTLTGPFGIDLGTVTLDSVENLVPGGTAHVTASFPEVPPLLLLFASVTVTPTVAAGSTAAGDTPPAPVTASTVAWAVPWSLVGLLALVGGGIGAGLWWRRRSQRLLGEELATYTEQIRAETQTAAVEAAPVTESEPVR
ncbi:hypothetical protein [Luethyella okanaganae]|uniref:DUF916 domain-containing protein n=1 Tax=Luethyella okanaganae TaxID=69372 RepID=A0ABW1VH82_9MICO